MKFTLIDYQPMDGQVNRDQTGTYRSFFKSQGLMAAVLSKANSHTVRLPVLSVSNGARHTDGGEIERE